jgi:predicted DNA-binding transcriptional regulator AlpA
MTNTDSNDTSGAQSSGIVTALGNIPSESLVTEAGLAGIMGKSRDSIRRAIDRGELPPPVRIFGKPTWTAGVIVRHIEERLAEAAQRADDDRERILRYKP